MEGIVLTDWSNAPAVNEDAERVAKRVVLWLVAACAVFTLLHYLCPALMNVPGGAQKIPYSEPLWTILIDLNVVCIAYLCFHHALCRLGLYKAVLFFAGAFVFTGAEESIWIFIGRFHGPVGSAFHSTELAQLGEASATYHFTRGTLWFFETPLTACLSWALIAYACLYVTDLLMPRTKVVVRAAVAGLLAVNLDMLFDPVQTHEAFMSWIWVVPGPIRLFGIRLSNYIGWFLVIFTFGIAYSKLPKMMKRHSPGKAAACFMGQLVAYALGIMVLIMGYSVIVTRIVDKGINITLWGIGS